RRHDQPEGAQGPHQGLRPAVQPAAQPGSAGAGLHRQPGRTARHPALGRAAGRPGERRSVTSRAGQLWLTAVCLLFGVLLMVQFRTQGKIAKTVQTESSADQALIIGNLYDANVALRNEVATLARQLEQQRDEAAPGRVGEMTVDLEKLRIVNGTAPARGPGV